MKDSITLRNDMLNRIFSVLVIFLFLSTFVGAQQKTPNENLYSKYQGGDPFADLNAFPTAPEGFEITLVAKEPLVRNPCAIAFDGRGRMFIGQGAQYRKMTPATPKDSVYLLIDENGDGEADSRHLFATGFNGIQGLIWRGNDLYVANSPDLSLVRDLDGDDVADEYVKLYTDLGNIEHALHGLNIAPDGRLYMSKGNSKGLSLPGRVAPKPFRELFGIGAPEGSPDFPLPQVYTAETYQATFHDPNDDWGRMGGVLRAEPDGSALEIVSRGQRNPWDINFSDTFDWLGGDNDQVEGDRFYSPFMGAHHGWNHAWSSSWTGEDHIPTAPAVGPLVDGSTTGVVYYDGTGFPEQYRGFFVGDWLRKVVYYIRPEWEGARMTIAGGGPVDFVKGGKSLLRTTDLEIGADGALYALSWGTTYGSVFEKGDMTNAGRVWRIAWKGSPKTWTPSDALKAVAKRSVEELLADLDHNLKSRRVNVADELVRRGASEELKTWLLNGTPSTVQQTWGLWTLGRIAVEDKSLDNWFGERLKNKGKDNFNTRLQSIRILGYRASKSDHRLPAAIGAGLNDPESRCRQAGAIAILDAEDKSQVDNLVSMIGEEHDRMVFYSSWQALRIISPEGKLKTLLKDDRSKVRLAALLALLETRAITTDEVSPLLDDSDSEVAATARSFLEKSGVLAPVKTEAATQRFAGLPFGSFVDNIQAASGRRYGISPETLEYGVQLYADDSIILTNIGDTFKGLNYIRGYNQDATSAGEYFLTLDLPTATTLYVAHDEDIKGHRPSWLTEHFDRYKGGGLRGTAKSYAIYQREFPAGKVTLGGNTVDGKARAPVNYFVVLKPEPLEPPQEPATVEAVLSLLDQGNKARGEWLFLGQQGPACWTCHQVNGRGRVFGPDLSAIGERDNARHWIESILKPNAIVTEGYATQSVSTSDGGAYAGVLVEESDLVLTLRQITGELVRIPKSKITANTSLHTSLMPVFAHTLAPRDVADLVSYLASLTSGDKRSDGFGYTLSENELSITYGGEPVTAYVMEDPNIPRPYFYNLNTLDGIRVTRNHPPIEGVDAMDHAEYHPGLWMAYGDISGNDYWRLKTAVKHERFLALPSVEDGRLHFAVENSFRDGENRIIGTQTSHITLEKVDDGYLIGWEDEYAPAGEEIVFGDQEEMGLGIRMATPLTELASGLIRTGAGLETAKASWGKEAAWSDYSGVADGRHAGITIMAGPDNFRPTWWHNRNYGAMVANAFGRKAMRQGETSAVPVKKGETLRMRYGVYVHSGDEEISMDEINEVFREFSKN